MKRDLTLRPSIPAELEALAQVNASDAERARERWHEVAPVRLKALADVTVVVEPRART